MHVKTLAILKNNPALATVVPLFLLAGIFLVVTPPEWYPAWFFSRLTGVGALLYALLILMPDLLFRIDPEADMEVQHRKVRSRARLQNYLALGCLLGITGTLGLYRFNFPFDKINHFLFPLLATIALSRFIYRWWDIPLRRALIITVCLVLFAAGVWELLEYSSDRIFGTVAFGQLGLNIFIDTAMDSLLDIAGIYIGVWLVRSRRRPWPY